MKSKTGKGGNVEASLLDSREERKIKKFYISYFSQIPYYS